MPPSCSLPTKVTRVTKGHTSSWSRAVVVRCRAMAHHKALPAVVTPDWLKDRLGQVKLLDTSWYLPPMGRDAAAEFRTARLPGAQFWDIDGVAQPGCDLPHMLPSEAAFAAAADALGITNDDTVVVYDGLGTFAAPRAWWTWRVFGHDRVAVLEGGLPAWKAAGLPLDTAPASEEHLAAATAAARAAGPGSSTRYKATLKQDKVVALPHVLTLVHPAAEALAAGRPPPALQQQVVDARPAGRFAGKDPEPRPGLSSGHMPGAKNVPFSQVYEGGQMAAARLLPVDQLAEVFRAAGVDPTAPLVCSCGSGLTACVLALALHQVTGQLVPVYDGSWSEWAATPGAPIIKDD